MRVSRVESGACVVGVCVNEERGGDIRERRERLMSEKHLEREELDQRELRAERGRGRERAKRIDEI